MNEDTIAFLRSLCAKAKEVANLCNDYLEREAMKSRKLSPSPKNDVKPEGNRLIPITKWNEYHSWPSKGGLRSLVFKAWENGSDYFIRRAGRRVLICEKSFFEWTNMSKEQRIKASLSATRWKEKYGRK